jgi:hypothetical protein
MREIDVNLERSAGISRHGVYVWIDDPYIGIANTFQDMTPRIQNP